MTKVITMTKTEADVIARDLVKRYKVKTAKEVIDNALADGLIEGNNNSIIIWARVMRITKG